MESSQTLQLVLQVSLLELLLVLELDHESSPAQQLCVEVLDHVDRKTLDHLDPLLDTLEVIGLSLDLLEVPVEALFQTLGLVLQKFQVG